MPDVLLRLLVGVLPVVLFLVVLIYLDSYKLTRLRTVLLCILAGGITAALCYVVNGRLAGWLPYEPDAYTRYVAPVIEETAKAAFVMYLVRTDRIGFLVDAAILGFAVGAGFALVENAYYLWSLPDAGLPVWIVRGLGTALMHGGNTCLVGFVSKALADPTGTAGAGGFVPGLVIVIGLHSFYNHFFLTPVLGALLILLTLPPLLLLVFVQSERALQRWLDVGFDADAELLDLIDSGRLSESPVGQYLQSLRQRFRGEVVADLLCYLRLHVELALRAKGLLLMRETGFDAPIDEETQAKLDELAYLERSIGRTGRRAMAPFLRMSGPELWQIYMLGGHAR